MSITLLHAPGVTIPAGTPIATPVEIPTKFAPGIVEAIGWRFPGGCNGQVGIKIASSHVAVFPSALAEWIVQSGDLGGYDVADFPDSGDFSVLGYNLGTFPHTIQIRYRVRRREPPDQIPGYLVADTVTTLRGEY